MISISSRFKYEAFNPIRITSVFGESVSAAFKDRFYSIDSELLRDLTAEFNLIMSATELEGLRSSIMNFSCFSQT